jgi:hypothetical protein
MARAEYWSKVLFTVSNPENSLVPPKVFEETNEKQTQLDKAHEDALRRLFKPYGMTVEREEIA